MIIILPAWFQHSPSQHSFFPEQGNWDFFGSGNSRGIFLRETTSGNKKHIVHRSYLSWKTLDEFQPKEHWSKVAIDLIRLEGLSEDEKRTLKLFIAAMKRWEKGIDDSNLRALEDFEKSSE